MSSLKQATQYYKSGSYLKVIKLCRKILEKGVNFDALRLMGLSLYRKSLFRDSLAMFEYAQRLKPNHYELQIEKIATMVKLAESVDYKSFIKAALILRKLIKEYPNEIKPHKQLKDIYQKMFFNRSAERVITDFLKNNPDSAEMLYEYYSFLVFSGRFEEAKETLDRAIELKPVYALDFTWEKVNKGYDPQKRIDQLIKVNETVEINDSFKSFYYLSRALAHQRQKDFNSAFKYFQKANNKYRKTIYYDPTEQINYMNHMIRSFPKENYAKFKEFSKDFSDPSIVPVFIVGLPRSGSTLIESILCAHDEVCGVGEINDFRENLISHLADLTTKSSTIRYRLDIIDKDILLSLRDRYQKLLVAKNSRVNRGSKAKYLINKMLTNYQYMPLIKAMFPNAKIIHATRHPLDMMWSSYKIFFNGDDNYIYNLKESAFQYNIYRELTDYWHSFMGDDVITVQHEKLTKNPEQEIRRLLEYCDLEWSDNCLNFHKQKTTVRTASAEQVRNPIKHKERMAWEDYEPHLEELIEGIYPRFLEEYGYETRGTL